MRKLVLEFLFFSLILMGVGRLTPVIRVRQNLASVVSPICFGATQLGVFLRRQVSFWFSLRDLAVENQSLQRRFRELESQMVDYEWLSRENEMLRSQLNLVLGRKMTLLPADVVGWEAVSNCCSLSINKGSEDGIKEGMAVIAGGSLVGRISLVEPRRSRVQLTTTPSLQVSAAVWNSQGEVEGVVRGEKRGKLLMEKIALESQIIPGDRIVTTGKMGEFPPGLTLGRVERVVPRGVLREALLEVEIDFWQLEEVFVFQH